jgi:hypothetical protein
LPEEVTLGSSGPTPGEEDDDEVVFLGARKRRRPCGGCTMGMVEGDVQLCGFCRGSKAGRGRRAR